MNYQSQGAQTDARLSRHVASDDNNRLVPAVTIVTPSFNAEATLARTIDSVRAQTFENWELLLLDDGSTDGTLPIAQSASEQDRRIRVFQTNRKGPGGTRNVGIAAARGEWLMFLDADDWLSRSALADLLEGARVNSTADVIVGNVARVNQRGGTSPYPRRDLSNAFLVLSHDCAVPIHSALVRRALVQEVGAFDENLRTSEDWDLWQRIARTGATFAQINSVVGFYRSRVGSLSRDVYRCAADGLEVMNRGHAPDPRVRRSLPAYASGDDPTSLVSRRTFFLLWSAAREVATGGSGMDVLHLAGPPPDLAFDPDMLGETLAAGIADMLAAHPSELAPRWSEFEPKLKALLRAAMGGTLGARSADLTLGVIKARLAAGAATDPDILDLRIGVTRALLAADAPYQVLQLRAGARVLGTIAAPLLARPGPRTLAEAIAQQSRRVPLGAALRALRPWTAPAFWKVFVTTFIDPRGLGLRGRLADRAYLAEMARHRFRECLARGVEACVRARLSDALQSTEPDPHQEALARLRSEIPTGGHDAAIARVVDERGNSPAASRDPNAWNEFFGSDDPWNYERSGYEQLKYADTLELVPDLPDGQALELACAEGHFTRRLATKVARLLATDISAVAVGKAQRHCSEQTNLDFATLDFAKHPLPGGPYDIVVCSEVLYYLGPQLSDIARKVAGALKPGGVFITAHANQIEDDPSSTGFDWGHDVGPSRIEQAFSSAPGLSLEREIRRPLYRVQAFRKAPVDAEPAIPVRDDRPLDVTLEPSVARNVVWGGGKSRLRAFKTVLTTSLPVLTYHRVSSNVPAALRRYSVTPQQFEAQTAWLRREGYWGVTPELLSEALRHNRPLPGRPVMISFDDGYQDFVDNAWPSLQRQDFPATIFVVSGKVGGRADWDDAYGEPASLMDWPTLARLSAAGCAIESHGHSHAALSRLPCEALYRELLLSRAEISREIGRTPLSLCYPFGAQDRFVTRAAIECGYRLGFSSDYGPVTFAQDPLRLRRVEITADDDMTTFARKVSSASVAFCA